MEWLHSYHNLHAFLLILTGGGGGGGGEREREGGHEVTTQLPQPRVACLPPTAHWGEREKLTWVEPSSSSPPRISGVHPYWPWLELLHQERGRCRR